MTLFESWDYGEGHDLSMRLARMERDIETLEDAENEWRKIMRTTEQRLTALEKLVKDAIIKPWLYVILSEDDTPDERERKQQQIVDLEAAGNNVLVYEVV